MKHNTILKYVKSIHMKIARFQSLRSVALTAILAAALVLGLSGPSNSLGNVEKNINPRVENVKIAVAGDRNYPPYEFIDSNNEFKGFNVDIIRAIAMDSNLDITLVPMDWNDALEALRDGRVDVVQGMTSTPTRQKIYDFSDFTLKNSQVIFVRKDDTLVSDASSLSGKTVAYERGDVSYEIISKIKNVKAVPFSNQEKAIGALLDKKVDAYVGERLTGIYFSQKSKRNSEIKIVGTELENTTYAIAVKKGNDLLLSRINASLASIKEDGTYTKIYAKWFGENISSSNVALRNLIFGLCIVTSAILPLSIAVVSLNKSLKSQIEKRIAEINDHRELIAQSDRLKEKIFENMESGIISFDRNGVVTKSNSYAEYLLELGNIEGQTWESLNLSSLLAHGIFENSLEGQGWRKNIDWHMTDQTRHIDTNAIPISGPDGIDGLILILHDITNEKQLQDVVRYKDKMEAIGKLSSGIAHELRNPITCMKLYVDMIPVKFAQEEFRNKLATTLSQELERLNRLVSLLLDYSKTKNSDPKMISLNELIYDTFSLLSPHIKEKNILLTEPPKDIGIICDEDQLKQVLINIILNAADAVSEGGKISIMARRICESRSEISITDNGCGIDRENIVKVFEPFFTTKFNGYGLGLSVCKQLLAENDGEMRIESTKGVGTTVSIILPGYDL